MQALSCALSGRDIIGLAETGSGKTLAYTLPMCLFLKSRKPRTPGESPVALILTPTRELMHQVCTHVTGLFEHLVYEHFSEEMFYSQFIPRQAHPINYHSHTMVGNQCKGYIDPNPAITYQGYQQQYATTGPNQQYTITNDNDFKYKAVPICGGVPIANQVQSIKDGADIIVATPGRLLDLCERGALSLEKVMYLVMDEADKMLGMGMEEQLRKIVGLATGTTRARQTLLWSATMPDSLERLARSAVLNPIIIQVGPGGLTAPSIQQNVTFLHHYQKPQKLLETLRTTPYPPVIVFASSIQNVDYVTDLLKKEQFHTSGLHSEKPQEYRFKLANAFRNGKVDVLVATDLASRGLDFPEVTHVINYDMPSTIEDYVHRCGRTGRMGHPGMATSFLTLDCKIAEELKEMLEIMEQPIPKELEMPKQFGKQIIRTEFGDRPVNLQ